MIIKKEFKIGGTRKVKYNIKKGLEERSLGDKKNNNINN